MGTLALVALRVVLAMVLAGSLFLQAVMVPLVIMDLDEESSGDLVGRQVPLIVIAVLAILTVQVTVVCIWRLLTMVRQGTVFSHAAFRYVDIVIGAIATASVLIFLVGVVLAPGEAVAPGVVLLIGGASVLIAGIALVVLVQRMLLTQAVARDAEAHDLQAELDEVI
jgi:hypothetical protein